MDRSNGIFGVIQSNYFVQCYYCRTLVEFRAGFLISQVKSDLKRLFWVESLNLGYVCPTCVIENFKDIKFPTETQRLKWMSKQMDRVTSHLIENFSENDEELQRIEPDDDIPF